MISTTYECFIIMQVGTLSAMLIGMFITTQIIAATNTAIEIAVKYHLVAVFSYYF